MLLFVICFNLLLAIGNSYLAVRLWRWRGDLKRLTKNLIRLEQCTHRIFTPAPANLHQAQVGTRQLRIRYQRLTRQLQFLQTLLQIVQLLWWIGQQQETLLKSKN
jgi:hypothetical protein